MLASIHTMTCWVLIVITHVNGGAVVSIPPSNFETQEGCLQIANVVKQGIDKISGSPALVSCEKTTLKR